MQTLPYLRSSCVPKGPAQVENEYAYVYVLHFQNCFSFNWTFLLRHITHLKSHVLNPPDQIWTSSQVFVSVGVYSDVEQVFIKVLGAYLYQHYDNDVVCVIVLYTSCSA
jgi:hypothetical protein